MAPKSTGLGDLLASLDEAELRVLVLFSSSTGRFGRTGQVDYAIANEVLNKLARSIAGAAGLPGRLGQLGAVGRRHGHAAPEEAVRSRRASA